MEEEENPEYTPKSKMMGGNYWPSKGRGQDTFNMAEGTLT